MAAERDTGVIMHRLIIVLLAAATAACSGARLEADYLLTYGTPYSPTMTFSRADIEWMRLIERESGGRIRFKPYWSGSLISSDMSMVEIRHGLVDIGLITPIYARGGAHMLKAHTGFYSGVRDIPEQVSVYNCLASRFPEFGYELRGLHVLAVQGGSFPGVLTRDRPIRTLADFQGLRLRTQSETNEVLKRLGADPVNMPMADVYSALAKGVIDGVVAPPDTIQSMHFSEVTKYYSTIRFSRGAYPARAISDEALRRLPPDLQALLLRSKPTWEAMLNRVILESADAGMEFARSHGVEIITFPAAEQARFDVLYDEHALELARHLRAFGLDGEPVLREAQRLIAAARDVPLDCAQTSDQTTTSDGD